MSAAPSLSVNALPVTSLYDPLSPPEPAEDLAGLQVRTARPDDAPAIADLHRRVFGPGRFAKTAYRIREHTPAVSDVCQVAFIGDDLIGAVRLTSVTVGGQGGVLLLGPMSVARHLANRGIGMALLLASAAAARSAGYRLIVLVGDEAYYRRAGYWPVPAGRISLPGPADPARVLVLELVPDALGGYRGTVRAQL